MKVDNGTTVRGVVLGNKKTDSFCTSIPSEESIQLIMIKVKNKEALHDLLYGLALSQSSSLSGAVDVDEENTLITAVPNEDGTITCLIFVYIDKTTAFRYRNIIISLGTKGFFVEYDIFFYSLTEEDFQKIIDG